MENEFSSLDVDVSAWEHRKMKLQLRNDSISTYIHAIEIYPHGGLHLKSYYQLSMFSWRLVLYPVVV
jgi:hypothetical protein